MPKTVSGERNKTKIRRLQSMKVTTLNKIIDDFNELPFEDRGYAVKLIQKQFIEAKRVRIAQRAKEAEANVKKGRARKGTVEDLIRDLEND